MGRMSPASMKWHQGLTGYYWLVLLVAALGWTFDTMDQWLYVQARTPATAATIVSFIFVIGLFVVLPFARETKGHSLPEEELQGVETCSK
ncbi:MAG: hypothetical protein K8I30_04455, partial [Anaerolineae bacterium]|nr:hypothetical protein [Anaerolineae bacterium]